MRNIMLEINKNIIKGSTPNWISIEKKILDSNLNEEVKNQLLSYPRLNLTKWNINLNNSLDNVKKLRKIKIPSLTRKELEENFKQYEKYIFEIIKTKEVNRKISKKFKKINLSHISNIFGKDEKQNLKEIEQEGAIYLWDALLSFGKRPENRKNFSSRKRQGNEDSLSSISTFVFHNMKNKYINLSRTASAQKYDGDAETLDYEELENYVGSTPDETPTLYREDYTPIFWAKICKELEISPKCKEITKDGSIIVSY